MSDNFVEKSFCVFVEHKKASLFLFFFSFLFLFLLFSLSLSFVVFFCSPRTFSRSWRPCSSSYRPWARRKRSSRAVACTSSDDGPARDTGSDTPRRIAAAHSTQQTTHDTHNTETPSVARNTQINLQILTFSLSEFSPVQQVFVLVCLVHVFPPGARVLWLGLLLIDVPGFFSKVLHPVDFGERGDRAVHFLQISNLD